MHRQRQIEHFLLAAHRLVVGRLHAEPDGVQVLRGTLLRWRQRNGMTHYDPYLDAWEALLDQPVAVWAQAVCADTEEAAALRSTSPIGSLLGDEERTALLAASRHVEATAA